MMAFEARTRTAVGWALRSFVATAIYWVAGKLALLMAIPPGYATAVWPAAGLALICVLFWGPRVAPGIALGSFLVNAATSFDTSSGAALARSLAIATGIGFGAALQATLGALLIRRFVGFPTALEVDRDITKFTLLGGPISCLASPTVGLVTLCGTGIVPWSHFAFSWWTWWVGDSIGVMIFTPLALLVVPGLDPVWRHRRAIVGIPLLVGFAVVTVLFLKARAWEETRQRTEFERRATPVAHALEARLSEYQGVVGFLSSLFEASPDVSRTQFREFCQHALKRYPGIQALGWNPRIENARRAEFEAVARREGLSGFEITEQERPGVLRRATMRTEYVPAHYVEPEQGNQSALGFDIASDPVRLEALTRARNTGAPSVTSRVTLVQEINSPYGILLIAPVVAPMNDAPSPRPLRGYAVGAFRMDHVVETTLRGIDDGGLVFRLLDQDASQDYRLVYASSQTDESSGSRHWSETFIFGGRHWTIEVSATDAYMTAHRSWQAWMVLAGGLLFVGILGVVILMATGRASQVQRALDELSAETARATQAEEKFRSTIEAASTGMLMVDGSGKIVLVNALVERLFGYTREELIGQRVEILVPMKSRSRHPDYRAAFFQEPKARLMGEGRELYGIRKDGSEVPVEIGLNPMHTADGDFVLGSIVDITARKRAENERNRLLNELQSLNAELEERVSGRTAELSKALREREVLIQEIHHRVKNNLQVISSIINMQVRKLDAGANRDALEECQTRVQAIALIHEKLYQSKDYSNVPFSEYARSLATNVFHATTDGSLTSVRLELDIEDLALAVDRAIPCGLVLNELITNALKHGFRDGREGTIRVELTKLDAGRLRLAVKDNGVGLPYDLDIRSSDSLGLQLICTLSEQLDAELEVNGMGGASFQLTFPA
ncbi:CHASE domain-containing protein [Pendulispora brunnea]|uniref:histidine kinase n=1 Tax=Pendulispora brunnea TaxID=2905690 RepID=A0ABZ2K0Z8_9BACT